MPTDDTTPLIPTATLTPQQRRILQQADKNDRLVPVIVPGNLTAVYNDEIKQTDIDQLADLGLLQGVFYKRRLTCPACGSERLLAGECCAACRCADIRFVPLIYHFTCAAVFPASNGVQVCPKCGASGGDDAADFECCGDIVHCQECEQDSPESITTLECQDCKWTGDGADAVPRRLEAYTLTEKGARLLDGRAG